ncbi:MAG: hypothetical protein QF666_12635 [Alphaproteobacteria bacterium]|jgi:hypothetical protein|nr:hypothetical protein [Alphaproteobacteria bacterium]MDP6590277.1 hypothetical protein [Alphaproteobacteria bacterium]
MKPKFDPGDREAVDNTRRLFGAFHRMEQLASGDAPSGGRLSFARLYAYVGEADTDPAVEAALRDSASLRADYRRLVEKFSAPLVPLAIAAASGEANVREGIGCRLHFVPSSAEPSQTYVIVEFTEQSDAPASTLFLCDKSNNCRKVALEAAREGRVQLLLENDSDLLARLMDKDTEIRRGL